MTTAVFTEPLLKTLVLQSISTESEECFGEIYVYRTIHNLLRSIALVVSFGALEWEERVLLLFPSSYLRLRQLKSVLQ